jgi:arsenate reductase
MSLRVYAYEKCDTCCKALKFLAAKKVAHEVIPIRAQPPTVAELRRMLGHMGGDLRKVFNTAGQDYRALDMKTRLPKLKVDEALALLASNGNLVKRPFALTKSAGAVGFREEEWQRLLAGD